MTPLTITATDPSVSIYDTPPTKPQTYGTPPSEQSTQTQNIEKPGQNNDQTDSEASKTSDPSGKGQTNQSDTQMVNGRQLTQEQVRVLDQLQQIDAQVRRHEMAHIAAGGRYITSGATFSYQKGPDGRNYAVGGEVGIDSSPVPGDPQATIQKMRQVKNAALAPADPSSQDMKVASQATSNLSKALSELMILQAKERAASNKTQVFGNMKTAVSSYEKVNNLPETDTSTFQIAI
ncbi:MAG: putative metalloprotease CJM1_0395 family protein [Pseudomonadota bacterium]